MRLAARALCAPNSAVEVPHAVAISVTIRACPMGDRLPPPARTLYEHETAVALSRCVSVLGVPL
jgi:hypothetical protein